MTEKVDILGVEIDNLTNRELLKKLELLLEQKKSALLITANAEMIMRAYHNQKFKNILSNSELVIADGAGLVLASKMLASPLKERIAGVDLVKQLLQLGYQLESSFYLLGARKSVIKTVESRLKQSFPGIKLKVHHGYLKGVSKKKLIAEINNNQTDILLVGMGSPLQEYWLARYLKQLDISFAIGVGGSFDILAGEKKRAPLIMQRLYLEWLYRLVQEPSRAERMLVLPEFIIRVFKERLFKYKKGR